MRRVSTLITHTHFPRKTKKTKQESKAEPTIYNFYCGGHPPPSPPPDAQHELERWSLINIPRNKKTKKRKPATAVCKLCPIQKEQTGSIANNTLQYTHPMQIYIYAVLGIITHLIEGSHPASGNCSALTVHPKCRIISTFRSADWYIHVAYF